MQKERGVEVSGIMLVLILSLLFGINNCSWAEEKGLVDFWSYDENEKTQIADILSQYDKLDVHEAKCGKTEYGNIVTFDGIDDYIVCGNSDEFNFGENDFSIEVWMKTTQSGKFYPDIVGKKIWSKEKGTEGYGINYRADTGTIWFVIGTGTWGGVQSSTRVDDGLWHQIVGVRRGSYMYIYRWHYDKA